MHRVWEWDFAQHAKDCQKLAAKTKTRTRKIELYVPSNLGDTSQDVIAPKKLHNLS